MGVLGLKIALCSVLTAIVGEFGRKMELVSLIAVKKNENFQKKACIRRQAAVEYKHRLYVLFF